MLSADDFYNALYGVIFELIAERLTANQPADATSLHSWVVEQCSNLPLRARQTALGAASNN